MTKFFLTAFAAAAVLAAIIHASAQQSPQAELQTQRNNFMSAFAQCDSASITLQQQLAEATAKIKALEDKYEPKAPPAK